jgi:hypothetical protein
VKGGKIGFSMANHLPRSPRLNEPCSPRPSTLAYSSARWLATRSAANLVRMLAGWRVMAPDHPPP